MEMDSRRRACGYASFFLTFLYTIFILTRHRSRTTMSTTSKHGESQIYIYYILDMYVYIYSVVGSSENRLTWYW